ncbi:thioredoxin domain-containing protein [Leifsonia sp. Root112D2]|jgi:uncharacterized protein YyaL (SSP411 family)|uniref:thioredoxin domain-containing protein n=1 Tax=Leifsonia sp. Root112D2 TaxID=1736426 RepID=UPI0006F20903|nr:DUF255 domain-containing protein [Leifsonia sp. Root112D2]KQV07400.1 hypothetical protein ASC63_08910 [Leifsonia sp. Root112D2]
MANRLADAISPYLRSHAENPVDWYPWGEEAFAEATRRDVPVLVSIGYSTCHWCHVMARETFSDPALAARLNEGFVAIKVDREEHPDVDASYLASAGAFTPNLGWPLNVFVTPNGRAFFAGTYFPPRPAPGQASFAQVLTAVSEAWTDHRAEVEGSAAQVAEALAAASGSTQLSELPDATALDRVVTQLAGFEDTLFGGFGAAPKFPVVPVLGFLLEYGARPGIAGGGGEALALARRALEAMAASPLRDPVEGGFFRYAVNRDWSQPHYERMLYDNAQLLDAYTRAWQLAEYADDGIYRAATGIARFLTAVMQLPSGGFASAQDSESTVDGERVEGGYYALGAEDRAEQIAPALDEKVLTGWNGLAIGALARAGFAFGMPQLVDAARQAADHLLATHIRADGTLVRASIGDRVSDASATLEDYGLFSGGLLELARATGDARYAQAARSLVDATLAAADAAAVMPFAVPGGADRVLAAQGLALEADPSEGAYPSGLSATAAAARGLFLLTAERRYADAARAVLAHVVAPAQQRPVAFGAALALAAAFAGDISQLVVVTAEAAPAGTGEHVASGGLVERARRRSDALVAVVTDEQARAFARAGFELFADRSSIDGLPTAYLCRDFICQLPVTDAAELPD